MATTYIKPIHRKGGIFSALGDSLDYIRNKRKTVDGELVEGYECQPQTAQAEFLLSKKFYAQNIGRDQGKNDVIAYHIRMSFKPGDVTAEKALALGRDLAMRWTSGKHQFVIAAHINTRNPHVHIVYNSVTLGGNRKYKDFLHSYKSLRRLSDLICLEHGLSIIENPAPSKGYNRAEYLHGRDGGGDGETKPPTAREQLREIIDANLKKAMSSPDGIATFDSFIAAMKNDGCEVKRGKHLAFKIAGGQRFIRCKSLGEDYEEASLFERISSPPPRIEKPNLLIDIQAKLQLAHSPGFEHFARLHNLKEMAKTLVFLSERNLCNYDSLNEKVYEVSSSFGKRRTRIKEIESRQAEISELQKQIGAYDKTKDVLAKYNRLKNAKPSAFAKFTNAKSPAQKFYEENESAIIRCRAAKNYFNEQGFTRATGKKIPTMKTLQTEYATLETERKKLWAGHRAERDEMVALKMAKQNCDMFLGEPRTPKKAKSYEHGR